MVTKVVPRDSDACKAAISSCFGADVARYAANKVRGGTNGKKGADYEQQFSAAKVAEVALAQLTDYDGDWPALEEQAYAFVDDLVLTTSTNAHYHQLKNVAALSWTAGEHPIATDFQRQVQLSGVQGEPPVTTTLVVSRLDVFAAMVASMPCDIAGHSTVEHFPYAGGSLNRLVMEHDTLRHTLTHLTRVPDPLDDDLANALGVLMIGIKKVEGIAAVDVVIARAQEVSPSLLRLFPWDLVDFCLDESFVNVLAKIPGLIYGVERGFFQWSAFGMSGVFQFNCLDLMFTRFQTRVIEASPSDFNEFEKLLP